MKILVTGGGSEEPIDSVRSVCNFSTGKTASFLSEYFCSAGNEVTALMGSRSKKPVPPRSTGGKLTVKTYRTFAELQQLLQQECKDGGFDKIIHAAAVSDYSPDIIEVDGAEYKAGAVLKIPSGKEIVIKMKQNPKLVNSLKKWAGTGCTVIAFKLTCSASHEERRQAVEKIFSAAGDFSEAPDAVVSNDLSEINECIHPCVVYCKNGGMIKCNTLPEMAEALEKKL